MEHGDRSFIKTVSMSDQDGIKPAVDAAHENEFLSRTDASRILLEIADAGKDGNWPSEVTPWSVGKALRRLMSNNGESDEFNSAELMRGFAGAESEPIVGKDEQN